MAKVLQFIAWLLKQVGRWTLNQVRRAADWARRNWRTVQRWIEQGVAWGTIVEWILRSLGIG